MKMSSFVLVLALLNIFLMRLLLSKSDGEGKVCEGVFRLREWKTGEAAWSCEHLSMSETFCSITWEGPISSNRCMTGLLATNAGKKFSVRSIVLTFVVVLSFRSFVRGGKFKRNFKD